MSAERTTVYTTEQIHAAGDRGDLLEEINRLRSLADEDVEYDVLRGALLDAVTGWSETVDLILW